MCNFIDWCNLNSGFLTVLFAFLMVVLTAVYVIVTARIHSSNHEANKIAQKSIETLKELEIERIRPYVICECLIIDNFRFFCIENIGKTTAHNIVIESFPPIKPFFESRKEKTEYVFLKNGILCLPPTKKYSVTLEIITAGTIDSPYTNDISCELSYKSPEGRVYHDKLTVNQPQGLRRSWENPEIVTALQEIKIAISNIERKCGTRFT